MSQSLDSSGLQPPREGRAAETSAERQALDTGAATRRFNRGLRRAGSSDYIQKERDPWLHLLHQVSTEYPFCTMYGVNIADGNIVSCQNLQQSLTFGPKDADCAKPSFDEHWQTLKSLCGKIKTGSLLELSFYQGRPVAARKSEGGRRFRRLIQKGVA
jgi:hypothetical protein